MCHRSVLGVRDRYKKRNLSEAVVAAVAAAQNYRALARMQGHRDRGVVRGLIHPNRRSCPAPNHPYHHSV